MEGCDATLGNDGQVIKKTKDYYFYSEITFLEIILKFFLTVIQGVFSATHKNN